MRRLGLARRNLLRLLQRDGGGKVVLTIITVKLLLGCCLVCFGRRLLVESKLFVVTSIAFFVAVRLLLLSSGLGCGRGLGLDRRKRKTNPERTPGRGVAKLTL